MAMLQNGQYVRTDSSAADASCWVEFFVDTFPDEPASQANGRLVMKEEERIRIYYPGNSQTRPVFKVTEEHKQRWPKEYESFRAGLEPPTNGIPIEQWPVLRKAHVLELKAMGFKTVEQISAANDQIIQKIGMGGRLLVEQAKVYLGDMENGALTARLSAENEKYVSKAAEQDKKIAELSALCENLHGRLMALQNAPSPVATTIPSMSDPLEAMRMAAPQEPVGQSSLANLMPVKRGPGRPRKDEAIAQGA